MPKLTPEQIVEKQIRRATAAVGDYREGVRRTTKKPMELAIRAIPKMVNNFLEAANDGTIEAGFASVSDADWKEKTATKGGDHYAKGVSDAKGKMLEFQQQFAPVRDAVAQQVSSMPSDTFEQRVARMVANAEGLHRFKFRKRRLG